VGAAGARERAGHGVDVGPAGRRERAGLVLRRAEAAAPGHQPGGGGQAEPGQRQPPPAGQGGQAFAPPVAVGAFGEEDGPAGAGGAPAGSALRMPRPLRTGGLSTTEPSQSSAPTPPATRWPPRRTKRPRSRVSAAVSPGASRTTTVAAGSREAESRSPRSRSTR